MSFYVRQEYQRSNARLVKQVLAGVMVALCATYIVSSPIACARMRMHVRAAEEVAHAFLRMREFGVVRASPNGRWLAIEVRRARAESPVVLGDMDGDERSDLWIFDLSNMRRIVVSEGKAGGTGAWAPVWSPDSRRLAFVSNRGTRGVPHLEVWDSQKGTVVFKTNWGIDLEANFGSFSPYPPFGRVPFAWLGTSRILVSRTADGYREPGLVGNAPEEFFAPRWRAALSGETSRTVWDSSSQPPCGAGDSLVVVDVVDGRETRELGGSIRAASVSPNRRYAVIALAIRPLPRTATGKLPPMALYNAYTFDPEVTTTMMLLSLDTGKATRIYSDLPNFAVLDATAFPRWVDNDDGVLIPIVSKPDHATLMYFRRGATATTVYVGRVTPTLAMSDFLRTYLRAGTPLVEAIGLAKRWVDVADATAPIGSLDVGVLQKEGFAVVDDHGVVVARAPAKDAILEAHGENERGGGWAILRTDGGELIVVFCEQGKVFIRREKLADGKRIQAVYGVEFQNEPIIEYQSGQATEVAVLARGGALRTVAVVNRYLNSRLLAPVHTINIGTGYQPSWARVYYPSNYRAHKAYPTVIVVYPGIVFSDRRGGFRFYGRSLRKTVDFYSLEPYYLAALGYLVVEPSLPMVHGASGEILEKIGLEVDGVAQSLIRIGLSSPGRIGVYGHSYGGYAALAAAVTSHRFAAIAASAAFADLYYYATFVPSNIRCEPCAPSAVLLRSYELETNPTVLNMGGPPWTAPREYEDDSATFRAAEISTPLLLIHGEFDVAPVESVEQLYLELEERGVPCRLVRYWGEGHSLESPGNVLDSMHELSAWFGRYLGTSRVMPRARK